MKALNWYRNNWYYVGGGIFVGLAIVMALFGELIDPVRRIMIVGYMGLLIHQFEEYVLPGGFPMVWNIVQSGERERLIPHNPDFQPIRVDKNNEFTVWGVVTYAIHKTRL